MKRTERAFRVELDKFIDVAKMDARIKGVSGICCPYRKCKNLKVWADTVTIRSHVIVEGFVDDYSTWIHHGEHDTPSELPVTDQGTYGFIGCGDADDSETFFDADLHMTCSRVDGNDDGGGGYISIPSGSLEGQYGNDDSDADELEQMLKHFKADVLIGSAKGLEHFKVVEDAAHHSVYEKGGVQLIGLSYGLYSSC